MVELGRCAGGGAHGHAQGSQILPADHARSVLCGFGDAAQVVELMGTRKGQMQGMTGGIEGGSRVTYTIPTRGLLGAAHALLPHPAMSPAKGPNIFKRKSSL